MAEPLPKRPQPETVSGSRKALHVEEKGGTFLSRYLPMILLGLVAVTIICIVGYMAWQDRHSTPMIQVVRHRWLRIQPIHQPQARWNRQQAKKRASQRLNLLAAQNLVRKK